MITVGLYMCPNHIWAYASPQVAFIGDCIIIEVLQYIAEPFSVRPSSQKRLAELANAMIVTPDDSIEYTAESHQMHDRYGKKVSVGLNL